MMFNLHFKSRETVLSYSGISDQASFRGTYPEILSRVIGLE
jgi:hypothetical protein